MANWEKQGWNKDDRWSSGDGGGKRRDWRSSGNNNWEEDGGKRKRDWWKSNDEKWGEDRKASDGRGGWTSGQEPWGEDDAKRRRWTVEDTQAAPAESDAGVPTRIPNTPVAAFAPMTAPVARVPSTPVGAGAPGTPAQALAMANRSAVGRLPQTPAQAFPIPSTPAEAARVPSTPVGLVQPSRMPVPSTPRVAGAGAVGQFECPGTPAALLRNVGAAPGTPGLPSAPAAAPGTPGLAGRLPGTPNVGRTAPGTPGAGGRVTVPSTPRIGGVAAPGTAVPPTPSGACPGTPGLLAASRMVGSRGAAPPTRIARINPITAGLQRLATRGREPTFSDGTFAPLRYAPRTKSSSEQPGAQMQKSAKSKDKASVLTFAEFRLQRKFEGKPKKRPVQVAPAALKLAAKAGKPRLAEKN